MQTPAINTDEIRINVEPLDQFDQKVTAVMPAHCIKQILDRLEEGKMKQDDQQIAQLLTNICVEETIGRQEAPPLWGPALPNSGPPPLPADGEDFQIEFRLDHFPEFKLPEFSSLTVRKPVREIDAAAVEFELTSQSLEAGNHAPHDGPVEPNDRITCSLTINSPKDDSVVASFTDLAGRFPSPGGHLLLNGILFPGLSQVLQGRSKGASISTKLAVPRKILNGTLGDQEYPITVTVTEVEHTTPASIDDLTNLYGSPSESVLRKQIRTSLEKRFEFEQAMFMTEDLFHQLLESLDYTPPNRIVNSLLKTQAENIAKKIKDQGGSDQDVQAALERERPAAQEGAVVALRRRAVIAKLRKELSIGLHEQNVQDRIRQLASLQNKRPEDLRKELVDAGLIGSITEQVVEAKITELALTQASIVEVDADSLQ